MDRLRIATIECKYKNDDRQSKEQFIHRLNDSKMLEEIIRELTESHEYIMLPSEQVFGWAKRTEAQRAQVAVTNSLSQVKNFDAI